MVTLEQRTDARPLGDRTLYVAPVQNSYLSGQLSYEDSVNSI
jgi:hypothetical protein